MKYIRLLVAACAVFVGLQAALPVLASADTAQQTVCETLGSDKDCTSTPHGTVSINSVVTTTISLFSWVIGIVAVIMIMVSGYKYITAAGDSNKVTSAKNTLIYAIIGLIVAALSQIIVQFVLKKLR